MVLRRTVLVSPFFATVLSFFLSVCPLISFLHATLFRRPYFLSCLTNVSDIPFLRLRKIHMLPRARECYEGNLDSSKGGSSLYYCVFQTNDNCNSLLEPIMLFFVISFWERPIMCNWSKKYNSVMILPPKYPHNIEKYCREIAQWYKICLNIAIIYFIL